MEIGLGLWLPCLLEQCLKAESHTHRASRLPEGGRSRTGIPVGGELAMRIEAPWIARKKLLWAIMKIGERGASKWLHFQLGRGKGDHPFGWRLRTPRMLSKAT